MDDALIAIARFRTIVLSVLTLFAAAHLLSAQSSVVDNEAASVRRLTLEELGNVEVTSVAKVPVKISHTPTAISVITQEDIRRSGATSITEILRLVPGVEVSRIDSNKYSIGVRGFQSRLSRSVLVLIDGRSVYTPLFAGVYWEVQDTLIPDIDRIEVIRGPGGTIWGANAVNGVINIITKSAKDTQGSLFFLGGGNVDQGVAGFRFGASTSNVAYRVYGKAFERGAEFHSDQDHFDKWHMGQAGFRADWSRNADNFTVQGDLYDARIGQRVAVNSLAAPFSANVEESSKLLGGNVLVHWRRDLRNRSDLQVTAYYDRTDRDDPTFTEIRNTFDVDLVHHVPAGDRHDILWGTGFRVSPSDTEQTTPTVAFTPNQFSNNRYNAFLQDEIAVVPNRISITVGSKFIHDTYVGFATQPAAKILWTAGENHSVWGGVTHAVRTPSRVETDLQISTVVSTSPYAILRAIGDRGFSTENLTSYEAGYRSLIRPNLYVDVTAFVNDYDDLLSTEPGTPFRETTPAPAHAVLPYYFRNGLFGRTSGGEISPQWTAAKWLRLKSSYSFLNMSLHTDADSRDVTSVSATEGANPRHMVYVQSQMQLPRKLEFDQTYRYISGLRAQKVPGYQTADVRFGWQPSEHAELSITGSNLLQPHHFEFGGDPGGLVGIKRSVFGRIVLRW